MAQEPEVVLVVGGDRHDGWTNVTVRTSIEELAGSFSVEYTQRWMQGGDPVAIGTGDPVTLRIGDTLVLTGYVDESFEEYDAATHTVSVSGRSKTADLIDCAAVYKGGRIGGKNLLEVAKLLCEPFGITVSLSEPGLDIGDAATVQIQDGESVFETLNTIARKEGVLLLSDPSGNLVLARAATAPLPSLQLRSAENIKRGSLRSSARDRFSQYLLKGQTAADPLLKALGRSDLKYSVTDDGVTRYRPFMVLDHETTIARLRQRAAWERNTRAGRSLALTYDVQGWTNIYGLWQPNTLLRVIDSTFGLDTDLLTTGVDFSRTLEGGRTARIELSPRETFDVLKPPKVVKRKKASGLAGLLGQ
jgi:prophage tail gpP-like protein